jgi:hypothetical protein
VKFGAGDVCTVPLLGNVCSETSASRRGVGELQSGLSVSGYVVARFLEALRYKLESRGFGSLSGEWNFSSTYSFHPHCGSRFDSAFNINEYQGYLLGVKAAGA